MFNSSEEPGAIGGAVIYGDQAELASEYGDFPPKSGRVRGVDLRSLPAGAEVVVDTSNSRYRFVILDGRGGNALVQGGRYFPEATTARVEGSTLRGSLVKLGWICVGSFLELSFHGNRIITSRVRSIRIDMSSAQ